MKKIKVKRHQQQTFTYLDERFCSHCGTKGVYKNGCDEHEELYCFAWIAEIRIKSRECGTERTTG
jgi:hypothetical protein